MFSLMNKMKVDETNKKKNDDYAIKINILCYLIAATWKFRNYTCKFITQWSVTEQLDIFYR